MKTGTSSASAYTVRCVAGGWEVFDHGGRRLSDGPQPKSNAVIHAKELARHGGAQILVYGENGKLESEFFYEPQERPSLERDDGGPRFAASRPAHARRGS